MKLGKVRFAAFAVFSIVRALGSVTIVNMCSFPVNLWSVTNTVGPMNTLANDGGIFSETYELNPNGGGISIKMTSGTSLDDPITQLEYTLTDQLYYDVSNVNGMPFELYGLTLYPSDPSCPAVVCDADTTCSSEVYINPNDNFATHACKSSANLSMSLCSGDGEAEDPQLSPQTSQVTESSIPVVVTATSTPALMSTSTPPSTTSPSSPSTIKSQSPPDGVSTVTYTTLLTTFIVVDQTVFQTATALPVWNDGLRLG